MTTVLKAIKVTKTYGSANALNGANLEVAAGEMIAIMGPSGSGKSTLLHVCAGIVKPDSGSVVFENQQLDNMTDTQRSVLRRTAFGFVFQFGQLVPELSALDNVALPLMLNQMKRQEAYEHANKWLAKVNLSAKTSAIPGQLSGGEAQRVAIARAMAIEPRVLFADEPTGALDSLNSQAVMELMVQVTKESNTAVVMVTHEPTIAAFADRDIVMRDGRLTTEPEAAFPTSGVNA